MLVSGAVSLLRFAGGLALASATELSFNAIGFFAALLNNGVDCIQNVFSKKLLMGRYSYVELQFYTSAAALVVQIPVWIAWYYDSLIEWLLSEPAAAVAAETGPGHHYLLWMLADATSYHLQSVFAYALMDLISPVTHSVANTVKRAVLIWLSVLFFENPVSWLSVVGTAAVVAGVFAYNWAREQEHAAKLSPGSFTNVPQGSPTEIGRNVPVPPDAPPHTPSRGRGFSGQLTFEVMISESHIMSPREFCGDLFYESLLRKRDSIGFDLIRVSVVAVIY